MLVAWVVDAHTIVEIVCAQAVVTLADSVVDPLATQAVRLVVAAEW